MEGRDFVRLKMNREVSVVGFGHSLKETRKEID